MLDHCFHCCRRLWRNDDKEEEEEKSKENDKVIYKNGIGEKERGVLERSVHLTYLKSYIGTIFVTQQN